MQTLNVINQPNSDNRVRTEGQSTIANANLYGKRFSED